MSKILSGYTGTKLFYHEKDGIFQAHFDTEECVEAVEIYEMKGIW